jgi:hypothetical protein
VADAIEGSAADASSAGFDELAGVSGVAVSGIPGSEDRTAGRSVCPIGTAAIGGRSLMACMERGLRDLSIGAIAPVSGGFCANSRLLE